MDDIQHINEWDHKNYQVESFISILSEDFGVVQYFESISEEIRFL